MNKRAKPADQAGFTIVELMIATAVLSTILLLVTIVMISIGNLYYKGLSQSRIQNNARSIAEELSQRIELTTNQLPVEVTSSTAPTDGEKAVCFGDIRYSYVLYKQIGTATKHVLWRDETASGCNPVPLNVDKPSAGGTELITAHSRLTALDISVSEPTTITVGVAYGDDDLLCDDGALTPQVDCNFVGVSNHMTLVMNNSQPLVGKFKCKGKIGDQFCATSQLRIIASRRLTGGSSS